MYDRRYDLRVRQAYSLRQQIHSHVRCESTESKKVLQRYPQEMKTEKIEYVCVQYLDSTFLPDIDLAKMMEAKTSEMEMNVQHRKLGGQSHHIHLGFWTFVFVLMKMSQYTPFLTQGHNFLPTLLHTSQPHQHVEENMEENEVHVEIGLYSPHSAHAKEISTYFLYFRGEFFLLSIRFLYEPFEDYSRELQDPLLAFR